MGNLVVKEYTYSIRGNKSIKGQNWTQFCLINTLGDEDPKNPSIKMAWKKALGEYTLSLQDPFKFPPGEHQEELELNLKVKINRHSIVFYPSEDFKDKVVDLIKSDLDWFMDMSYQETKERVMSYYLKETNGIVKDL